jgi:DNA-binding response OmpR family regulator/anti-sigma regulatory factor (Ser/Thr protein kinase)
MRPLNILAIDDDPLIGMVIAAFVQRLGHTVVHVLSGDQALIRYAEQAFDLVLVDRQMPGLDGLDTTRALREMQQASGWLPIIMLSGGAAIDEQVLALNAGCDDFIAKPINFQILEAKINSFWRIARMQQQIAGQHQQLQHYASLEAEERRICSFLMERLVRREMLDSPLIKYLLQPAAEVSGDLLLACTSRNGDVYVMLADATGHGLPAALTLIPLSQAFYAMAAKGYQLDTIARELNHQHRSYSPSDRFVAATMAMYNPRDSSIEVWNGGLPPALLIGAQGQVLRRFRSHNLPLGILPNSEFICETETVQVPQASHLLLFSDGLIEAENAASEQFGMQLLERCVADGAVEQCLDRVQEAVLEHLQGSTPHDDLSCLLLDCRAPISTPAVQLDVPPTPASSGLVQSWEFNLCLQAEQLRRLDLEPLLTDFCNTLGLDQQRQGPFSLILRELITNALDHGLLGLGSELKDGPEGFERYLLARIERLEALNSGQIRLDICQIGSLQGNQLSIEVTDSGPGFDWASQQNSTAEPSLYHGRGLQLVRRLSHSVQIHGRGNQVTALLCWDHLPITNAVLKT